MHVNNLLAYSCKPTEASESSLEWRDIALLFFFFVHNSCDDGLRISSQALSFNDNRQCRILLIIKDTDHMVWQDFILMSPRFTCYHNFFFIYIVDRDKGEC